MGPAWILNYHCRMKQYMWNQAGEIHFHKVTKHLWNIKGSSKMLSACLTMFHFSFLPPWNFHLAGWINNRKWQTVDLLWGKIVHSVYFSCHVFLGICGKKAAGNNDCKFEKLIMAIWKDVKPLKGLWSACSLDGLNATHSVVSWLIVQHRGF